MQSDSPTNVNPQSADSAPAALPAAPKPGINTSEFWILALILASIQAQAATGKIDAFYANALCVLASLLYAVARNWLKTHHTGTLADLTAAALDAGSGSSSRIVDLLLSTLLKIAADKRPEILTIPHANPGAAGQPVASGEIAATPATGPGSSPAVDAPPMTAAARSGGSGTAGYMVRSMAVILAAAVWLGLCAPLWMSGCTTAADGTKQLTPKAKQVLSVVGDVVLNAAINAGVSAAEQYANDGKVDGGKLAAASISGAAFGLRSLESTPQAASPQAITYTLLQHTDNPAIAKAIAPVIANSVQVAIANGAPPSTAVESAAAQLDAAALAATQLNAK